MKEIVTDKFVAISDRRFHYREWGDAAGPTLVLVHGIGDDSHVWDDFSQGAAARFRIIAPDQRGHGTSDWARPPAYRCEDYVSDLEQLIAGLELPEVILMGHSMGALHATCCAARHPDRVIALIHADIEPCPPDWNKKYLDGLYERLPRDYPSIGAYAEELRKNSPYAREDLLCRLAGHALTATGQGNWRLRYDREVLRHFDRYDLRPRLPGIRCPALIIRGCESRVMSADKAREMSAAVPLGSFAEIPLANHPLHTDNPEEFQRVVMAFLSLSSRRNVTMEGGKSLKV